MVVERHRSYTWMMAASLVLGCGGGGAGEGDEDGSTSMAADEGQGPDDGAPGPDSGADSGDDSDDGEAGDDDSMGEEVEPCGTFTPGDAFTVCAATYLGGPLDDGAGSVAMASDGTLVYGGALIDEDLGQTPTPLGGGGEGVVVRLSADGREVSSVSRLGAKVEDVAIVGDTDAIAVTGAFGVAVLSADATEVVWQTSLPESGHDIAAGSDGHVAVVHGNALTVFDPAGQQTATIDIGGAAVNDVAIDGDGGTVFVTGFKQDDGYTCTQLQIPFIHAFGYDGTAKWTDYDWTKEQAGDASECADSRGIALAMGGDGKLYYAGESHGGNTVHRRLPRDLSASAPVETFDPYNDPYNLNGAAPITFYARLDPSTGDVEVGQFLVTRLSDGKGNAVRPHAIAADAEGNVFVAGATACCIENGLGKTVNGEPAMPESYAGGGFVVVVSPDFKSRLAWTTFRGPTGNGETAVALAAGANVAAVLHQSLEEGSTNDAPLLTFDAVRSEPGGGASDGYLVVWPGP